MNEALAHYASLLRQWNAKINLVSQHDVAFIETRHIENSLLLLPFLPKGVQHILDVGSGGGFPAIPLALKANCAITMVESDKKKAAFLREATRQLGIKSTIITERIEKIENINADIVTARAFAPLEKLLFLCYKQTQDKNLLLLKGEKWQEEVNNAKKSFAFSVYLHHKKENSHIIGIEKGLNKL